MSFICARDDSQIDNIGAVAITRRDPRRKQRRWSVAAARRMEGCVGGRLDRWSFQRRLARRQPGNASSAERAALGGLIANMAAGRAAESGEYSLAWSTLTQSAGATIMLSDARRHQTISRCGNYSGSSSQLIQIGKNRRVLSERC